MKKLLVSVFAIVTFALSASAQKHSTHSFSLRTLYGLEYSYEYKWDSGMALIGRVGAGGEVYSPSKNNYSLNSGFNLTIEPRYYLNKLDFLSAKVNGVLLIPNTTLKASIVPVYGIKRDFSKHWFCEFTIGGGIGYYSGNKGRHYFEPHLQFRIGAKL